jgi:hypothetical protein
MPVPNSARLDIRGTLAGGADVFSTSVWLRSTVIGGAAPGTNAQAQTAVSAIVAMTQFSAFITAVKAWLVTTDAYTNCALYSYPTGHTSADAIGTQTFGSSTGLSTQYGPRQMSRVITLRTGQAGRSFRGRMYIPAPGVTILSNGLIQNDAQPACDALTAWFRAMALASFWPAGTGVFASVHSPTRGVMTSVTQVSCDSRPDIQRRRANRLPLGTTVSSNV